MWTSSANAADGADRRLAFHKAASLPLCCSTYIQMISLFIPTQGVSCRPYADDLCIATQKQSFEEVEKTLGDALAGLTPYYAANHLRANPEKTQISTFHLKNRDAQRELKVVWHGKLFAYSHKPVYIGVTLDRCLTYKDHIAKTKAKTGARNSILKKLANTNWGTDSRTIRTAALALCFSAAE